MQLFFHRHHLRFIVGVTRTLLRNTCCPKLFHRYLLNSACSIIYNASVAGVKRPSPTCIVSSQLHNLSFNRLNLFLHRFRFFLLQLIRNFLFKYHFNTVQDNIVVFQADIFIKFMNSLTENTI